MSVRGLSADQLDARFLTDDFFQDPYAFYRTLHEHAPVYRSEKANAWLVCPFAEVEDALRNPRLLSSGRVASHAARLPENVKIANATLLTCMNNMMSFRDPPDHTRLRRLVSKAFTANSVAKLEPEIELIVNELLDNVAGEDSFDLVTTLSFDLPALVICRLLGIPRDRLRDVKRWADGVVSFVSSGIVTPDNAHTAQLAVNEAGQYLDDLLVQRRANPQEDVLTKLALAEGAGDALDRDELVAMVILLFFAGFETTEGLIGNATIALLRNRDQFMELRQHPHLIDQVVEECLRYDNSIHRQSRVASSDVEFCGQVIPRGELIFLMIGAANRDPTKFRNPDQFNAHRDDLTNVSFGQGIHFCLGAPLARLETKVALRSLAMRMPDLKLLDPEPRFGSLLAVRKPEAVWLTG